MILRTHEFSYNKIKDIWSYLYSKCEATVYQHPIVIEKVSNSLAYTFRRGKAKFIIVFMDERPILACGYRRVNHDIATIIGTAEGFDHSDIVYDEGQPYIILKEALIKVINHLKEKGFKTLNWKYIKSSSTTNQIINDAFESSIISRQPITNVRINLSNTTYEEYFSSLSKHVRQNYRTSINRLSADSMTMGGGGKYLYIRLL